MIGLRLYRLGNRLHYSGYRRLAKSLDRLAYMLSGCSIPASATIGEGTQVAYGGMSVVIHTHAVIGAGCLIGQGVTVGAREAFISKETHACPQIGDNIYIAAGAKILGDITIGSNSIVGANAVVLASFPAGSIIGGIPATLLGSTEADYRAIRL
jgi:serine O-acetyltransferase